MFDLNYGGYKNKFRSVYLAIAAALIAPKIGAIDLPIIILLILVLIIFYKYNYKYTFSTYYYYIVVLWLFLISLSIFTILVNGNVGSIFFLKPFRQIVLITLAIIIVKSYKISLIEFFKIIIIAALLNTALIFVQLTGHNYFKIEHYLIMPEFNLDIDVPFRKPGFMAGYPHAGMLSVIGMCCLLAFAKLWRRFIFIFILFCFTLSLVVTSRSALLAGIAPLILFFSISTNSKIVFNKLFYYLTIGVSLIIYIVSILPEDTFNVAFEMFINLSDNKGFTSESSTALADSYYYPSHFSTYIFGNGKFMRNDLDLNVDDGFQIMLYGCGIVYLMTSVFIYVNYAWFSLKGTEVKFLKFLIILIFILIFIFNFKADFIFSRVFSDIFSFFVAIGLLNNKQIVFQRF